MKEFTLWYTVLFLVRTQLNIQMFPDQHYDHVIMCRETTTQIIEYDAPKVFVIIDQQLVDNVSFDGAYVFLQGSYESGEPFTAQLNEMFNLIHRSTLKSGINFFDSEYMKSYMWTANKRSEYESGLCSNDQYSSSSGNKAWNKFRNQQND